MTRAVTMLVVVITFFAFANMGSAGGLERVQGQMVHAKGAVTLLQSQHDRCQIAAPVHCHASCVLLGCSPKAPTFCTGRPARAICNVRWKGAWCPEGSTGHRRHDRLLCESDKQPQIKGTQDA